MQIKKLLYALTIISIVACSEDNDVFIPRNLQEYININSPEIGEVIACAANADGNTSLTYVFYYPEEGATDIRYYEADSLNIDQNDYSKYRRIELNSESIFGGKLARFNRSGSEENWCLVTYSLNGKLHKSNPIRLKNATKSTSWQTEVTIEYPQTLMPKFSWSDFGITDNAIYFQVISDESANFISGTYTYDTYFQYYDISNVVLNINTATPQNLTLGATFNFTLMGVSEDNWVNLVIEKPFVTE